MSVRPLWHAAGLAKSSIHSASLPVPRLFPFPAFSSRHILSLSSREKSAGRRTVPLATEKGTNDPFSHKENEEEQRELSSSSLLNDPSIAQSNEPTSPDGYIIYGGAFLLFVLVVLGLRMASGSWEESWEISPGDLGATVLWGISLYYVSPLQLLLLFLGRIETERPSDWVLRLLGTSSGLDVDAIDYVAPLTVRLGAAAIFALSGLLMAMVLEAMFGDATWAVSTGIGSLFAAGLYEVGRPERLSVPELQELESQWQDFRSFADAALVPNGRCHETEIFSSFRRRFGKYRKQEQISDARLRQMLKNWWPKVERSPSGWYKNVSLPTREQLLAQYSSDSEGRKE